MIGWLRDFIDPVGARRREDAKDVAVTLWLCRHRMRALDSVMRKIHCKSADTQPQFASRLRGDMQEVEERLRAAGELYNRADMEDPREVEVVRAEIALCEQTFDTICGTHVRGSRERCYYALVRLLIAQYGMKLVGEDTAPVMADTAHLWRDWARLNAQTPVQDLTRFEALCRSHHHIEIHLARIWASIRERLSVDERLINDV